MFTSVTCKKSAQKTETIGENEVENEKKNDWRKWNANRRKCKTIYSFY